MRWAPGGVLTGLIIAVAVQLADAGPAGAEPVSVGPRDLPAVSLAALPAGSTTPAGPAEPAGPRGPGTPAPSGGSVSVDINGVNGKPSNSIVILLALTVLSVAPAVLLLCTSFTKILVVLSITRNALGLTSVPPNQVLAGLALFLSLFIMGPVLSQANADGVQPYLKGAKTQSQAFADGSAPLRAFMVARTRGEDLALLTRVAKQPLPKNPQTVPITTLVPAFVLSELRAAMIIGFAVYVPFLVIDMVVAAALMSMGMMMLPPVTVSLPFKLLLFVLANGWGLVVTALVASYR
ncbi:MAG: flagellar type III secretion system pore protein FliP [Actinobacteria bacterium]|nr:flagellar type III secretion system pore protein FliP [Actinomycetota bacterium]